MNICPTATAHRQFLFLLKKTSKSLAKMLVGDVFICR